ncbi:MAG: hypothetical protein KKF62_11695 [Bacteroidetes bacterium]|nr:hypothetical protein [Bacteroidota bacterium]MBU1116030.1 hypothetical protein [Bacteroidota bacterium]MBU1799202.1 hypothetical protein [Bacteroidota bacterium]
MELVPIIYSSLLVVFSILSVVVIISLIFSKIFKSEKSNTRSKYRANVPSPIVTAERQLERKNYKNEEKEQIVFMPSASRGQIDKELVYKNKIRVVSKTENQLRERMKNDNISPISRYLIVNSLSNENVSKKHMYSKFSKISVEYSQGY